MLATYTSYPTTEYLEVEGQDLFTFNVFLEREEQLRPYLRHLQVRSGDAPLVVTELGLAAAVHGEDAQAESLDWQLRVADETGCAGAVVFAWTDEWAVGGQPVEGWGFGLTGLDRKPKPALEVVSRWAPSSVRDLRDEWPSISVVVCAHNGDRLLEPCLESLMRCDYPDLEVILCDDGSTDDTFAIAQPYPILLFRLPHGGLSAARNAGVAAATGEIVAYLDADAQCHPEWPYHLALSLEDENTAATGGPNLPVPTAGLVERTVAASPGGPVEVLLRDDRAEHVPGCNMAFKREALTEIGLFEPAYTTAGDDVDVCWKLLDRGGEIAFSPAAQVRHHRRDSVRGYLKQQRGYGRAERLLAAAHPHRFNGLGQARWRGFIYGGARLAASLLRPVVYHGQMGTAPFQPVVRRPGETALAWLSAYLPLLVPVAALGLLAPLSFWWLVAPAFALAAALSYGLAVAVSAAPSRSEPRPLAFRALAGLLHLAQPFARTWGRLRSPSEMPGPAIPAPWIGERRSWLDALPRELAGEGCRARPGGRHSAWDLEATIGLFARCRVTTAVLWRWTPVFKLQLRPRRWLAVPVAAGLALLAVAPLWAAGLLTGLGAWTAIETLRLRRRVRAALGQTTRDVLAAEEYSLLDDLHPSRLALEARPQGVPEGAYD